MGPLNTWELFRSFCDTFLDSYTKSRKIAKWLVGEKIILLFLDLPVGDFLKPVRIRCGKERVWGWRWFLQYVGAQNRDFFVYGVGGKCRGGGCVLGLIYHVSAANSKWVAAVGWFIPLCLGCC